MATYISEFRELRIVKKPAYTKEVEGRIIRKEGETIEFRDGKYTTEDEEEIEFLEQRPEYGRIIKRVDKDQQKVAEAQKEMAKNLEDKRKEKEAEEAKQEKDKMDSEGKGDENFEYPEEPLSKWNRPPLKKKAKELGLNVEGATKKELYRKVKEAKAKDEPQF